MIHSICMKRCVLVPKNNNDPYCKAARPTLASKATRGFTIVAPISPSCKNVLYLLMVVGRTSADGREKSQYRMNVFGGGSEIHR